MQSFAEAARNKVHCLRPAPGPGTPPESGGSHVTHELQSMDPEANSLRASKLKPANLSRISAFERLDDRITPAVNAFFIAGQLTIVGDATDNEIVVSRDARGALRVNDGTVPFGRCAHGGQHGPRANPRARGERYTFSRRDQGRDASRPSIFGGGGNDTLIGGSASDLLFGQAGKD